MTLPPWLMLFGLLAGSAQAADLVVTVTGLPNDKGLVRAALYAGEDGFGRPGRAVAIASVAPHNGVGQFTMSNLPPGRYALMAFQDEQRSGVLRTNFLGIPTEVFGFSNDARGRFGMPSFDQASFALPAQGTALVLELK